MKNLTVNQLKKACIGNNYLALRFRSGGVMGVNCRLATLSRFKDKPNLETDFISYHPIGLNEYLNIKHPFA